VGRGNRRTLWALPRSWPEMPAEPHDANMLGRPSTGTSVRAVDHSNRAMSVHPASGEPQSTRDHASPLTSKRR